MDNFDSLLDAIVAVVRTIQDRGYDALQDPLVRSALKEEIEFALTGDKTKKSKTMYGSTSGASVTSSKMFVRQVLQLRGQAHGTSESLAKIKDVSKPEIVVE